MARHEKAALAGAALGKTQSTAHSTTLADVVGQAIAGQTAASRFLFALTAAVPDPDLLFAHLGEVLAANEPARLRGFCRSLQKHLEGRS